MTTSIIWRVFHHKYLFYAIIKVLSDEREAYRTALTSWNDIHAEKIIQRGDLGILIERMKRGDTKTGFAFPSNVIDVVDSPSVDILNYVVQENKRIFNENKSKPSQHVFSPFGQTKSNGWFAFTPQSKSNEVLDRVVQLFGEYSSPCTPTIKLCIDSVLRQFTRDSRKGGRHYDRDHQDRVLTWINRQYPREVEQHKMAHSGYMVKFVCVYRTANLDLINNYVKKETETYLPSYFIETTQHLPTASRLLLELNGSTISTTTYQKYKKQLIGWFSWLKDQENEERLDRLALDLCQVEFGTVTSLERFEEIIGSVLGLGVEGGIDIEQSTIINLIVSKHMFSERVVGSRHICTRYVCSPGYLPIHVIIRIGTLEQVKFAVSQPIAKSSNYPLATFSAIIGRQKGDPQTSIDIYNLLADNGFLPKSHLPFELKFPYSKRYFRIHTEAMFLHVMRTFSKTEHWDVFMDRDFSLMTTSIIEYLTTNKFITYISNRLICGLSKCNNLLGLRLLFSKFPKQEKIFLRLSNPYSTRFIVEMCSRFNVIVIGGQGARVIGRRGSLKLYQLLFPKINLYLDYAVLPHAVSNNRMELVQYLVDNRPYLRNSVHVFQNIEYTSPKTYIQLNEIVGSHLCDLNILLATGRTDILCAILSKNIITIDSFSKCTQRQLIIKEPYRPSIHLPLLQQLEEKFNIVTLLGINANMTTNLFQYPTLINE
ncbi:hypothetical protein DFA_04789 [Cavenderia fasciculata]|uniref:Uncharacterized protein n=1 Tax=Cavenderia fasciculata TaxID=261658 RepID=F4PNY0_CACFS|nr:uncharacterized protein DFA_04789 [Cavenderia fasciculata]EGG22659.1 hypothetical protein DFA_04789 [Cavenderia fasciculata]|eukprot:XP_004360510.1 hypothetical protein DFA_04789 [Cavenderia fasciculata]